MYKKIGTLLLFSAILLTSIFGVPSNEASAYKKEGWKLGYQVQSYKWGASLKDGVIKTGWKNGANSWKSKTSTNVGVNFFYHSSSVHFLTRFTEKDSNYFGKMNVNYNTKTKVVTKYAGYLNDYAVKNSKVAQSTAVHELGHALGIAHNNGTSIMNSNRDRNKMITPQTDDVNGVKSIYK
ncbi:matrixin family metalloprotease [Oceanobacillus caeni]|uniref:matrixin family metalloprotease n=2 Tax=Bacillales TaxID=1385 RepID=UPI000DA8FCF8|nr:MULTISPECIES: matrixin family metalloprotease [Bacillaceae]PZD83248.1 peptidase [Bacilli bacterium]MCR1836273.1 matrixin family metalloprotease [Oceanobacillus caeni]MED4475372.1 matrixin family metalloprotease [Oceanobacillus caeni]PZD84786.1 peptidase [Bacilli bacterium]RCO08245.1 peptidase [Bacilli bacterium]